MERSNLVSVFESESDTEIQNIQTLLKNQQIETVVENVENKFNPETAVFAVKVDILNEIKAFDIIDEYLQSQDRD